MRVRGASWCAACAGALAGALERPPGLAVLRPHPAGLPAVVVAGAWEGALRGAVLAYKERGVRRLARPLGLALRWPLSVAARGGGGGGMTVAARGGGAGGMTVAARGGGGGGIAVVGVPASRAGLRARGHDHVRTLVGAALAGATGGRLIPVQALAWTRRVEDQAGLGGAARRANLAGALRVTRPPRLPVLLVDDVVTTGSTLAEAARALWACGVPVLGAVALAATSPEPLAAGLPATRVRTCTRAGVGPGDEAC